MFLLGVLWSIGTLWGCRPKISRPETGISSHPIHRWGENKGDDFRKARFGRIEEGRYYAHSGEFSLPVSGNWQVEVSGNQVGLLLRVENVIDDCAIEIWKYEGIQYRPTSKNGCIWSFQDKGLYSQWGQSRAVNVATCRPIESTDDLVFVYLYHRNGNTWQLESHVSRNNLIDGLHQSDQLLREISWFDDVANQTEEQNPVVPVEN